MLHPSVDTEPPPGWVATEITRPALGGGSGATVTQWVAARSPVSGDVLLLGCVATPIPGWVEEMRPAVEGRLLSLASSAAERIVGVQVETRDEGGRLSVRPAGATDDLPRVGVARTFIGWSRDEVVTCFATCATPQVPVGPSAGVAGPQVREPVGPSAGVAGPQASADRALRACDGSVDRARLRGSTAPPPPGPALGAVTWAVHHPSKTVVWGGLLAFFVGMVAVVSRRRPRSRI